jgi:hypothetical protein
MERNQLETKNILVTIAHPHGDVEVPLDDWVRIGPGPRPFLALTSARHRETGEPLPIDVVPIQFHNNPESLRRIAAGEFDDPWGRDRLEIEQLVARIDQLI